MFFSHFLLLSATSAIYAMTTQETEQRDLNPLILPLFGNPQSLEMNTWYWQGNDRRSITASISSVQLSYESNDIIRDTSNKYTKTIVFGSWKFANADSGRPSSAVTLAKDELANNFEFSIRQGNENDTFLKRLLRQFNKKMISIWWDSTTPSWKYRGPHTPIAELAIGGMNPSRFVAGTEMRLQLLFTATTPWYWDLQMGTTVLVGNIDMNWNKIIQLSLHSKSDIPMVIYDAITKPLRDEMAYTVGLMKGLPKEVIQNINQYEKVNKPIFLFDCKDAPKLLPLRIGQLTIPPSMMYNQISAEKCKMTLRRNDYRGGQNLLIIGIDIIRQFYFSVIYNTWNAPTIQFTTRIEGAAPPPPTGPPCESSQSLACATQNPSAKCCVIS